MNKQQVAATCFIVLSPCSSQNLKHARGVDIEVPRASSHLRIVDRWWPLALRPEHPHPCRTSVIRDASGGRYAGPSVYLQNRGLTAISSSAGVWVTGPEVGRLETEPNSLPLPKWADEEQNTPLSAWPLHGKRVDCYIDLCRCSSFCRTLLRFQKLKV